MIKNYDAKILWGRKNMDWTALSAIGTIAAAVVGIVGIFINLWDRTRKLHIDFQVEPPFRIYLSNASIRAINIVKIECLVGKHIFYSRYFEGEDEICLLPATVKSISLDRTELLNAYCELPINIMTQHSKDDSIKIILFDNRRKKYKIEQRIKVEMLYKKSN